MQLMLLKAEDLEMTSWGLSLGSAIGVPYALPFRREDHENKAGQEGHPQRQVLEELVGVGAGFGEEAPLQASVAEGHGEEYHGSKQGVHVVHGAEAQLLELAERPLPLLLAGEVEHVEAVRRGHAVVELAVAAEYAVGEGEEDAQGGQDRDQRGRQPFVRRKECPVVGEGRGQCLVRKHRARRQELREVCRARHHLVRGGAGAAGGRRRHDRWFVSDYLRRLRSGDDGR
jgi:hypothetical protein